MIYDGGDGCPSNYLAARDLGNYARMSIRRAGWASGH
jgi:hypothetical protein